MSQSCIDKNFASDKLSWTSIGGEWACKDDKLAWTIVIAFLVRLCAHVIWALSLQVKRDLPGFTIKERSLCNSVTRDQQLKIFGYQAISSTLSVIGILVIIAGNLWVLIALVCGDLVGCYLPYMFMQEDHTHILRKILKEMKEQNNDREEFKKKMRDLFNLNVNSGQSSEKLLDVVEPEDKRRLRW